MCAIAAQRDKMNLVGSTSVTRSAMISELAVSFPPQDHCVSGIAMDGNDNTCLYDAVCAASIFGQGHCIGDVVTAIQLGRGNLGEPGSALNIWHLAATLKRPIYVDASSAGLGWVRFSPPVELGSAIFICLKHGTRPVGHYVALQPHKEVSMKLIRTGALVVDDLIFHKGATLNLNSWLVGGSSSQYVKVAVRIRASPQSTETDDGVENGQVTVAEQDSPSLVPNTKDTRSRSLTMFNPPVDGVVVDDSSYDDIGDVLDSKTTQFQVYEQIGRPLLTAALGGLDVCLMAYGASGSGKTYTLTGDLGDVDREGMTPRLARELFSSLQGLKNLEDGHSDKINDFSVRIRYFEVYGNMKAKDKGAGRVLDLLYPYEHTDELLLARYGTADAVHEEKKRHINLRRFRRQEWNDFGIEVYTIVEGLNEKVKVRHRLIQNFDCTYEVKSAEELLSEKARADGFRATSAHARNAVSSRSHALFTMEILIQRDKGKSSPWTKWSNVHVCDLAGFETIAQTKVKRGQDLHNEGLAISRSLEALKTTLKDRKAGNKVSAGAKRSSNLIYLLLDCLGGQASMTVVVNVSPLGGEHLADTKKTLEFAMLAKAVRQAPTRSFPQLNSNAMKDIIRKTHDLEAELERAKERLRCGEGNILEINKLKNDLAISTKYLEDSLRAKDDAEVSKLKQIKMNEVHYGSISKLSMVHDVLLNFANEETFCEVGQPRVIVLNLQQKIGEVKTCEENMQKALQMHISLCHQAKALTDSLDTAVNDFLASKLKVESLRHLVHIKTNSWKVSETIQKANEALTLFNTNAQKVTKHLRSIHFSCLDVLLSADLPAACHKLECAAAIFSPCVPDNWDQDEGDLDSISDSKPNVDVVDINDANSSDDNQNVRFISMTSSIEVLFDSVYPGDVFHEDALDDSPAEAPVIIKWTSAVLHHARRVLQSWLESTPMGDAEVWEKTYQGHFSSAQNPQHAPDAQYVDFFKVCHHNYSDVMVQIGQRLLVQIDVGCSDWRATVKLTEEVSEGILSINLDALEKFSTNGVDSFNALLVEHASIETDVSVEHLKPNGADCIKLDAKFEEIMNTICVQWIREKRSEHQSLQEAKDEEIESLNQNHADEHVKLNGIHAEVEAAREMEIQSLREEKDAEFRSLTAEHQTFRNEKEAEIETLREEHEVEFGELEYQKDVDMESLRETFEAEGAQLQQEHQTFRDGQEVEMILFREAHEAERAHLQTHHEDQLVAKDAEIVAVQSDKSAEGARWGERFNVLQQMKNELDAQMQDLQVRQTEENDRFNQEKQDLSESADQLKAEMQSKEENLLAWKQTTQALAAENVLHVERLIHLVDNTYSNPEEVLSANPVDPVVTLGKLLQLLDVYIQGTLPPPIAGSGLDVIRARQQARSQSISLEGGELNLNFSGLISGLGSLVDNGLGRFKDEFDKLKLEYHELEVQQEGMDKKLLDQLMETARVESKLQESSEQVEKLQADAKVAEERIRSIQEEAAAIREGLQAMQKLSSFIQAATAGGRPLTPMQQEAFEKWIREAEEQTDAFKASAKHLSERLLGARDDMISKMNECQAEKELLKAEFKTKTIELVGQYIKNTAECKAEYEEKKNEVETTRKDYCEKLKTIDADIQDCRTSFVAETKVMQDDIETQVASHIKALEAKVNGRSTADDATDWAAQIHKLEMDKQAMTAELHTLQVDTRAQEQSSIDKYTKEQALRAELEVVQEEKIVQKQLLSAKNTREQALRVELEEMQVPKIAQLQTLSEKDAFEQAMSDEDPQEQALGAEYQALQVETSIQELMQSLSDEDSQEQALRAELEALQVETSIQEQSLSDKDTHEQALRAELEAMQVGKSVQEKLLSDKDTQEQALRVELKALQMENRSQEQLLTVKETQEQVLRAELEALQVETSIQEQSLRDKDTHGQVLRAELEAMQTGNSVQEKLLSDKDTQEQALRLELETLQVKNTSQEHLLSDKNTQEQALRVTLKSLQTELEASSAQILQVNSKSQHAGEIEAKLNVEIASLRTEHEREQKKMIDIKDLHDKANMQLEVERAKFETFVISKKELQVEADSLRESLKEALNARAENKEELSAAQTGTPPGDGHTEDHLSKSQALQSVNEDLEAQLKSLRDQLDTLRKVDSNTAQPPSLQTATDAPSGASVGSADNTAKQNKKKSSTRKAAPCVVS